MEKTTREYLCDICGRPSNTGEENEYPGNGSINIVFRFTKHPECMEKVVELIERIEGNEKKEDV